MSARVWVPCPKMNVGREQMTDVPKILRRLAALKKIAVDQAGTPEGENAGNMMAKLLEAHPLRLASSALDLHEQTVTRVHDWEADLVRLIAHLTHCDVQVAATEIIVRGLRVAVEETVRKYEKHRAMLESMAAYAVLGYLFGAFDSDYVFAYLKDQGDKSQTVEAGKSHIHMDDELTELEANLIRSAEKVGADDPVTFWEDLGEREKESA